MKKVYGSPKADQKNRETFMFSSFSFSALVVATYNNKLQKRLCDNCWVYMCEQKEKAVTNLLPAWEKMDNKC